MDAFEVLIREFRLGDLGSVMEIEKLSFSENQRYSEETFIHYHRESPDCFFVAEHMGKVIGYIICSYVEDYGHIVSLAVRPEYRGRGVGRKLLEKAEETLRNRGVRIIILEVAVSNKIAYSLYRKMGYRVVSTLERYYGDEDAYLMIKTLM